MDEQTKGFRSAVFGGFRREDVLRYIEETDARYYEESERLRSGLDDAQTAMGELRGQNEKLTEKNAELLERLGAMTVPMGPGNTDKQIRMMIDMKSTVLCATSSYALLLAEEITKRGVKDQIHLRKGVIGSERCLVGGGNAEAGARKCAAALPTSLASSFTIFTA